MKSWTKRELIGEIDLDTLSDGSRSVLKAFRKWWPDNSSCLDIIKYVSKDGKEQCFFPTQHIQIPWALAGKFVKLFR